MINSNEGYPPDFSGTPWEMYGKELELWKQFQALHCCEWIRIWFNVRVGSGEAQPENATPQEIQYWKEITQRRIDVIAETSDNIIIIELRCNADKGTFGAAMLYRDLWNQTIKTEKKLKTLIVTNRMRSDMKGLCERYKIEVKEIQFAPL